MAKKIGEYREDVVEKILSIIGWCEPMKGITIPCSVQNGEHKKTIEEKVLKHTVYISSIHTYQPIDNQLNNIIISSKYSMEKYSNSPTQNLSNVCFIG